jgi:ribokinase
MIRPKICVVGASNMDLVSYVARLPEVGETLVGERFQMGFGGKGANQAAMCAKLGADVSMVTKVGRDIFGESTLKNFRDLGIGTEHVRFADQGATGVAPITVDADGHNSIIIVTGANDELSVDDVEAARGVIAASQVLLCQLETSADVALAALRIAREAGVTTVFNPSPATRGFPNQAEAFALTDVLCPNEGEANVLTGVSTNTDAQAALAGKRLLNDGARAVVVTLGERGCLLCTERGTQSVPGFVVKPLDTAGAGDCFLGSLAFFLGARVSMAEAIRRANHIASISVQALGTQSSFPSVEDLPSELLAGL